MESVIAVSFGKVIKKWRQSREMNQIELARKCGLDRTFISLMETGKKQPSLSTVFLIAKALKVDPEELVRQTNGMTKRASSRGNLASSARRL